MTHPRVCGQVEEECFRLLFIEMEEWLLKTGDLKKLPASPFGWLTDLSTLPVHTCILDSIPPTEPTAVGSTCAQFKNPGDFLKFFIFLTPIQVIRIPVFSTSTMHLSSVPLSSPCYSPHNLYNYKHCNCFPCFCFCFCGSFIHTAGSDFRDLGKDLERAFDNINQVTSLPCLKSSSVRWGWRAHLPPRVDVSGKGGTSPSRVSTRVLRNSNSPYGGHDGPCPLGPDSFDID